VTQRDKLIERLSDADIDFFIVGAFAGMRETSVEIELFERRCRVISINDLMRAKESLARPRDLFAAEELRAIL
jgi:hypothetical protein